MTSKTKTLKATTPKYFSPESSFFGLFRNSLSSERNCSMNACKNLRNITGHVLSGFSQCSVYIFPQGKLHHFKQNLAFLSSSTLFASEECLQSVKDSRNVGFRKLRPLQLTARKLRPPNILNWKTLFSSFP